MKDLKYLLLLITVVAIAHITKRSSQEKRQAKFLPDLPDAEQRHIDSTRIQVSNSTDAIVSLYK